jgi:hypothetical protein
MKITVSMKWNQTPLWAINFPLNNTSHILVRSKIIIQVEIPSTSRVVSSLAWALLKLFLDFEVSEDFLVTLWLLVPSLITLGPENVLRVVSVLWYYLIKTCFVTCTWSVLGPCVHLKWVHLPKSAGTAF